MRKATVVVTWILSGWAALLWLTVLYRSLTYYGFAHTGHLVYPTWAGTVLSLCACVGWVLCWLSAKHEVGAPRCRKCGYLLRGLTEARCPECGTGF